jgi:hypothetical protein
MFFEGRREAAKAFLPNFVREKRAWPQAGPEMIDSRYWKPDWQAKYGRAYRTTVHALDLMGIDNAATLASRESYYWDGGRGGVSWTTNGFLSTITENFSNMSVSRAFDTLRAIFTQPIETLRRFRGIYGL